MQHLVQFDYTALRTESESILKQLEMGSTEASMHEIRASTPERVFKLYASILSRILFKEISAVTKQLSYKLSFDKFGMFVLLIR